MFLWRSTYHHYVWYAPNDPQWNTAEQASSFRGFVDAVPQGKFVVIDMSVDGAGEWKKWNNASFFGAPFIWTTLHDFGGTDGMKGNMSRINQIPFDGMAPQAPSTVWGTGYTPEGIDQNPVYYEFMAQANFREAPVPDIASHVVQRSYRRYGLTQPVASVNTAWRQLVGSTYSQDLSVQDGTGIPHLPGYDRSQFLPDNRTPTPKLCLTYKAWGKLISASEDVDPTLETFRYDLVNVGREVLAQLSTPLSNNFSDAFSAKVLDTTLLRRTGGLYVQLLKDVDALVATDSAFQLGPWLESAKAWGASSSDCGVKSCPAFYEWNARAQLTTWNPTPANASKVPDGPVDYASKHWSGLIRDYYAARAQMVLNQALADAAAGRPLDTAAVERQKATLAYNWQNARNLYPTHPVGNAVQTARAMYIKYQSYFALCL
jgi:alpha-N-acetylglucosaminidase